MIQHHILLVDGDKTALASQANFLQSQGFLVTAATTAEEAVDRISTGQVPAVAISADELPGEMSGFELCLKLRSSPATCHIQFILISRRLLGEHSGKTQAMIRQTLKELDIGMEDYLPRSVSGATLVERIMHHITETGRTQLEAALLAGVTNVGRLEYLGPVELLQFFSKNSLSGKVSIHQESDSPPQLFFRSGSLIDARLGKLTEEKAFFGILSESEGTFEISFGEPGRPARISTPTQNLISEGQKRVSEIRWIRSQLPPLNSVLTFNFELLSERLGNIPDEENRLLRLFDGRRSLARILAKTDFDELDALRIINNHFFEGVLIDSGAVADASVRGTDSTKPTSSENLPEEPTPSPIPEDSSAALDSILRAAAYTSGADFSAHINSAAEAESAPTAEAASQDFGEHPEGADAGAASRNAEKHQVTDDEEEATGGGGSELASVLSREGNSADSAEPRTSGPAETDSTGEFSAENKYSDAVPQTGGGKIEFSPESVPESVKIPTEKISSGDDSSAQGENEPAGDQIPLNSDEKSSSKNSLRPALDSREQTISSEEETPVPRESSEDDEGEDSGIEILYFFSEDDYAEDTLPPEDFDKNMKIRFHDDFSCPVKTIIGGAAADPHVIDVLKGLCDDDEEEKNSEEAVREVEALLDAAAAELGLDLSNGEATELPWKDDEPHEETEDSHELSDVQESGSDGGSKPAEDAGAVETPAEEPAENEDEDEEEFFSSPPSKAAGTQRKRDTAEFAAPENSPAGDEAEKVAEKEASSERPGSSGDAQDSADGGKSPEDEEAEEDEDEEEFFSSPPSKAARRDTAEFAAPENSPAGDEAENVAEKEASSERPGSSGDAQDSTAGGKSPEAEEDEDEEEFFSSPPSKAVKRDTAKFAASNGEEESQKQKDKVEAETTAEVHEAVPQDESEFFNVFGSRSAAKKTALQNSRSSEKSAVFDPFPSKKSADTSGVSQADDGVPPRKSSKTLQSSKDGSGLNSGNSDKNASTSGGDQSQTSKKKTLAEDISIKDETTEPNFAVDLSRAHVLSTSGAPTQDINIAEDRAKTQTDLSVQFHKRSKLPYVIAGIAAAAGAFFLLNSGKAPQNLLPEPPTLPVSPASAEAPASVGASSPKPEEPQTAAVPAAAEAPVIEKSRGESGEKLPHASPPSKGETGRKEAAKLSAEPASSEPKETKETGRPGVVKTDKAPTEQKEQASRPAPPESSRANAVSDVSPSVPNPAFQKPEPALSVKPAAPTTLNDDTKEAPPVKSAAAEKAAKLDDDDMPSNSPPAAAPARLEDDSIVPEKTSAAAPSAPAPEKLDDDLEASQNPPTQPAARLDDDTTSPESKPASETKQQQPKTKKEKPPSEDDSWEADVAKAEKLLIAEKYSAASKIFEAALKKRPDSARALTGLGRSLVELNPRRAIKLLRQAVAKNPADKMAWYDLGVAYQFVEPEQNREAVRAYEQFLKLAPNSVNPSAKETRAVIAALKEDLAGEDN